MSEPGSSGKVGPTPIPESGAQALVGEQVRPSFHFGMHELRLGDKVTGIHRGNKKPITGTVVLAHGCICLSTEDSTLHPVARIAIHEVQPPLFDG